ncbi:glycosyltransferase [Micrococcus terreus]|uniref:glycosyltransferase n=1 Tax=Micrococcus terreus TaxID=574650 RepID=UPI0030192080
MRIAVLTHMLHPIRSPFAGGLEMHTAMTVEHLVRRGHEVTVYAREGTEVSATVIPVLEVHPEGREDVLPGALDDELDQGAERACQMILDSDAQVVLNNSLSAAPLRLLRGLPMVTVLHTPATLASVLKVLDDPQWTAPPGHRWLSVSASNALAWRHRLPRIAVVPNGIELAHWHSTVAPVPGRAVWTGRITEEKGLHVAIEAARLAGMELHFAGPVSDPSYHRERIEPLLGPDTVYWGHLDHQGLPDLLASGEVYLSTPLWAEPFGLATVEAMAVGTPVAALLAGSMGEIVAPQAGDLAVHHSARSLADSIEVARTRERAQVQAWSRRFSSDLMVDTYLGVLHEAGESAGTLTGPGPGQTTFTQRMLMETRDRIDPHHRSPQDMDPPRAKTVETAQ